MNDKELFRYLQELKVILNDINSTKEENKKAIYNLKDQLESLRITHNMYFFEYKLFRMKVLFLCINFLCIIFCVKDLIVNIHLLVLYCFYCRVQLYIILIDI